MNDFERPFAWWRTIGGCSPDTPDSSGEHWTEEEFLLDEEIQEDAKHLFIPLYLHPVDESIVAKQTSDLHQALDELTRLRGELADLLDLNNYAKGM